MAQFVAFVKSKIAAQLFKATLAIIAICLTCWGIVSTKTEIIWQWALAICVIIIVAVIVLVISIYNIYKHCCAAEEQQPPGGRAPGGGTG